MCLCVCVRERERDNGSCVSCSPTYLLFSVFLILRFLKSGSGLHLFLAHMNVNIALQFFLMSFKLKKKQSHIDDILEGKRDREMALWTPGSSTQPGTTGRQLKKKKPLRLCCQVVPGLLAAGVQTAPASWQPLRSEEEVSSWTLTGTINSRSPTS